MKIAAIFAFALLISPSGSKLEEGDVFPEIEMQNSEGEWIKLSSLRGQMVLVDFWASWCKPCRMENPEIVRTYLKYKSESFENGTGFTVFSISLDKSKEAWLKAIAKDNLIWKNHFSELKGWKSDVALSFGITSLPMSYLIDGNGRIVAVNPRGGKLEKELKKSKESTSFFRFLFNW